jgi:hypothetical protein
VFENSRALISDLKKYSDQKNLPKSEFRVFGVITSVNESTNQKEQFFFIWILLDVLDF